MNEFSFQLYGYKIKTLGNLRTKKIMSFKNKL